MFGLGGLNPKKMQGMMAKMGISQEEIDASKVIIEKTDGNKIIFENPSVTKMTIQGKDMFQIQGEALEQEGEVKISEEDVKTVMEKTGVDEAKARETLEKTKDLADAIMELSE